MRISKCVSLKSMLTVSTALMAVAAPASAQLVEDEVIVTATLRAENIQDVPIAVTAIQPEQLQEQNVVNIQNLTSVAPSFSTSNAQTNSGTVVLRIRGVGTTSNNIGFESAVGVFIDGAYQSRPGVALGEFVDVERVEVLRGPQGTLFGRNTSAGALNITNVRPDLSEYGGFFNATAGNFEHVSLQGAVNIPLSEDKVAARLTGAFRNREGFVRVFDRDGQRIGSSNALDQALLRGQIGWDMGNGFEGRVIADFSKSTGECCSALEVQRSPVEAAGLFGAVGLGPRGGMVAPNVAVSATDDAGAQAAVDDRIASSAQVPNPSVEQYGFVVDTKYAVSDNTDFVYIGSYREFDADDEYDTAFSGLDIFNVLDGSNTQIQTMTHEARLQGDAMDGRLSWLVGGFYAEEDIRQQINFGLGTDYNRFVDALILGGTAGAFPTPAVLANGTLVTLSGGENPADVRTSNLYRQDSTSWSIFTHNTFDITDRLDFTLGLRYSDESKDGSFSQPSVTNDLCPSIIGPAASFPIAALRPTLIVTGCLPFVAPADLPLASVLPLPRTFADTFEDDELIYTAKLGYKFTPEISGYASFTHGYKAGGFNLDSTAAIGGADPRFDSETVDAFELGLKSDLFDGRMRLNVAAFLQEFEDFQVLEFTGAQFTTFNVPKAESKGVEIEASGDLTDAFSYTAGLTYTKAEYPDDCATSADALRVQNLCGFSLTNAPEIVGILGGRYEHNLNNTIKAALNAQVRYEDDRRTSTQGRLVPGTAAQLGQTPLNPFDVQDGTFKINARLALSNMDETTALEFWGTNLTDEVTRAVTFNTTLRSGSRSAFIQEPRMYGVTLRQSF